MLSRRERIEAAGGAVIAVVADEPDAVRERMMRGLDMPWPVIVDPDRELYAAWGLPRASLLTVYSPRALGGYVRAALRRERIDRPGRDTLQLGGDFVIAADGVVAYAHPQADPSDRPPAGELVQRLEALTR